MPEEIVGKVSSFFARPVVAGIDLTGDLKAGDTIIAVDGHPISSVDDLVLYIAAKQVGDEIEFDVVRGGKTSTVKYRIEEAQKDKQASPDETPGRQL